MQRNRKQKINNKEKKKCKQKNTQFLEQLLFKVFQGWAKSKMMQKTV